jgi:inorganic pyrophosphatase
MSEAQSPFESLTQLLGHMFKAHPWHGISIGKNAPAIVNAYIEIVPSDTVKFEVDKATGHLYLDRPQRYSNVNPTLYGLIPRTYCGENIAALCNEAMDRTDIVGDGDPLDICVLSEKTFSHGDFMMEAVPIGGIRMIDGNEADDKIIAVMKDDASFGEWKDLTACPQTIIDRLTHYFLTYKDAPGDTHREVEIAAVYGAYVAKDIIKRSERDYLNKFPDLHELLNSLSKVVPRD